MFFFFWSCIRILLGQRYQMSSSSVCVTTEYIIHPSDGLLVCEAAPRVRLHSETRDLEPEEDGRTHSKYCTSVRWVQPAMATQLKAKHIMTYTWWSACMTWSLKNDLWSLPTTYRPCFLINVQIEASGFIIKNVQHAQKIHSISMHREKSAIISSFIDFQIKIKT